MSKVLDKTGVGHLQSRTVYILQNYEKKAWTLYIEAYVRGPELKDSIVYWKVSLSTHNRMYIRSFF